MAIINMQTMRYLNLLDRVTHVKTTRCFVYNNTIVFAVPQMMMMKAIGPQGRHVKEIQNILGKRVKIVQDAMGIEDAKRFIQDLVEPAEFKSFEIHGQEIVIGANMANKAALIGRNKSRLMELNQIAEDSFGKQVRIV